MLKKRIEGSLFKTPLRILYYSLIYPYFHYCNVVWVLTHKTNLRRLVTLQKRAVRIINNSNFDAHTDRIFKELSILKFNDIHLLRLGQFNEAKCNLGKVIIKPMLSFLQDQVGGSRKVCRGIAMCFCWSLLC